MNEYYGAPTTRMDDYLAHYGIKGMKWGVRKAVALGNQKMLDAHFRKAAKKLYKLQDKALHSGKYAAKAAGYGAAAAGAGTLAIGGTGLAAKGIKSAGKAMEGAGRAMVDSRKHAGIGNILRKAGHGLSNAGESLGTWGRDGKKPAVNVKPSEITVNDIIAKSSRKKRIVGDGKGIHKEGRGLGIGQVGNSASNGIAANQPKKMSNNTKFRIGAGVAALGLGAASARNAYIAAHGRKYMDKAEEFKRAMDDSFAGTKYQGYYIASPKQRKRRRR